MRRVPRRFRSVRRLLSLVDAMATPHNLDRYLELVNPMASVRDLRAEVVDVHRQTRETVTLILRPTWQWEGFDAGQFVQVGVVVDGVRHTRCYSPASSRYRDDGRIELTIKRHTRGLVSRYLHAEARPGLVVTLSQAAGTFRMPTPRPNNILLISGGSGITPVLSMLRTLDDEGYTGAVAFLHYADTEGDVPYRTELAAIAARNRGFHVTFAYTAQENDADLSGHFGIEHLRTVAPWHRQAATFVCGPTALLGAVRALYRELGSETNLYAEVFTPPVVAIDDEATGRVSFAASGVTTDNSGASLLDQAEAAGLAPEHGCRMGICYSCVSIKKSGCTRNLRTGDTACEPDQPIQLCISAPVGDVVLDI
ncbi:ferredoxin reductase [Nocardia sp. NPDC058497]|uniref:ferredoxin reductase n=1 Tax=Nocardia sp. NPDC058497 TaxID=3346529 RepID=UPI00364937DC